MHFNDLFCDAKRIEHDLSWKCAIRMQFIVVVVVVVVVAVVVVVVVHGFPCPFHNEHSIKTFRQ